VALWERGLQLALVFLLQVVQEVLQVVHHFNLLLLFLYLFLPFFVHEAAHLLCRLLLRLYFFLLLYLALCELPLFRLVLLNLV